MSRGRLKEFLIHPIFISLVIWGILLLFIPPIFSKYKIKLVADKYTPAKMSSSYYDLDSDGNSEEISLDLSDAKQTKIIVRKDDKIVDQFDLVGQPYGKILTYVNDYNLDRFQECYVFTINKDSILLNIIDPFKLKKVIVQNRLVDFRVEVKNSIDAPIVVPVGMIKNESNKYSDLIFYINSGYSKHPRNLYRYIIAKDSLIKSPESAAVIYGCTICNINDDALPEFVLNVGATGNYDEHVPYSDQYSWLMVLDKNLHFLFSPIRLSEHPSRLVVSPFRINKQPFLLVFQDYYGTEDINSCFLLFDQNGKMIDEKITDDFESEYSNIIPSNDSVDGTFYFIKNRNTDIEKLDSNFQVKKDIRIPEVQTGIPLACFDANNDGRSEYFFQGKGNRYLIIMQGDFKDPVTFHYNDDLGDPMITRVLSQEKKPLIYLQFDDRASLISYKKNPLYYFKYPFYGVIYLILFLFISLIYYIQQYRLKLNQETEKKIASLQMRVIKNQIDPHFILNVLNAIGSLYSDEKTKDKADYIFGKYAKLIRQTVLSSDQINATIEEELDFVRNFIEIEQFRRNNSFNYAIKVDKDLNIETRIPRMLIQTFVENSIKYGIRQKEEGGILRIDVHVKDNILKIIIVDNGNGVDSQDYSTKGTGKGLAIVKEMIDLFYRLENIKITFDLENVQGDENIIIGTKVTIKIPFKNPKPYKNPIQ
jgi:hypothetical protein